MKGVKGLRTNWSSGQDGGVGRNPLLPRTTKRKITTNLKLINNQKHQKIKLHETPTTKELKKKSTRTTRLVRQTTQARKTLARRLSGGGAGLTAELGWLLGRDWLKGKTEAQSWLGLRLGLLRWEILPVWLERLWKSTLEMSRLSTQVPLWPLPHRQRNQEGCPAQVNTEGPAPYNLSGAPR